MAAKKKARKFGSGVSQTVKKVMHERKEGTLRSGRSKKKVTNRKQAVAIALSEARASGKKVPRKKAAKKSATKKSATKKSATKKRTTKRAA